MAQRKRATTTVSEEEVTRGVREELQREGIAKLSAIKPAGLRANVASMLLAEGFELTANALRRPLAAQLVEALSHGALVPIKSLPAHVRGASGPELKRLVDDAVGDGLAQRVQRGSAVVLCGADVRVVSAMEAKVIKAQLVDLSKALEKATKTPGLSLLLSDVTTALSEATSALHPAAPAVARKPSDDALHALLDAVDSTRDERTGLSFVPAVVGRLAPPLPTSDVLKVLLNAAQRELLELRPEGGIGRLSEAELSVCPQGPHGTRLSWARRITEGAR